MISCKPIGVPMDTRFPLDDTDTHVLQEVTRYHVVVGKPLYLKVTLPSISYVVRRLGQFIHDPCEIH